MAQKSTLSLAAITGQLRSILGKTAASTGAYSVPHTELGLVWVIRTRDRASMWPITHYTSCRASRGKQPTGDIVITAPRRSWWVAASGLLDDAGGPGNGFLLECYLQNYATPLQIARIQGCNVRYSPTEDHVVLTAESVYSWCQRARLVWADASNDTTTQFTGKADNVLRAIWRANMLVHASLPTDYPDADRIDFDGLTIAVEADTTSHPTTITFDVDAGRNMLELSDELTDKFGMRGTFAVSGSTVTLGVDAAPARSDRTFGVGGKALTDATGGVSAISDDNDYSAIRNVWCIRDGTNRTWASDPTSEGHYGQLEDVKKISAAGAASSTVMREYERDQMLADKDPVRAMSIDLGGNTAWQRVISDWTIADSVSLVCEALGTYQDIEVVGLEVEDRAGEAPKVSVELGDVHRSYAREAWRRPGPRGGFGAGSNWVSLSG